MNATTNSLPRAAGEAAHKPYSIMRFVGGRNGLRYDPNRTGGDVIAIFQKGPSATTDFTISAQGEQDIVDKLNSHSALVEALQQAVSAFSGTRANDAEFAGFDLATARAALKSATEGRT